MEFSEGILIPRVLTPAAAMKEGCRPNSEGLPWGCRTIFSLPHFLPEIHHFHTIPNQWFTNSSLSAALLQFEYEIPSWVYGLNSWCSTVGTIWGSLGNFSRWGFVRGRRVYPLRVVLSTASCLPLPVVLFLYFLAATMWTIWCHHNIPIVADCTL